MTAGVQDLAEALIDAFTARRRAADNVRGALDAEQLLAGAQAVYDTLDAAGWRHTTGLFPLAAGVRNRLWQDTSRARAALQVMRDTPSVSPKVITAQEHAVRDSSRRAEGAGSFVYSLLQATMP